MAKPICPKCEKRVHVIQKIIKKKKGLITKRLLITLCSRCKYNFDVEDFNG